MAPKRRISPPPTYKSQFPAQPRPAARSSSPLAGLLYLAAVGVSLFLVLRHHDTWAPYTRYLYGPARTKPLSASLACHADFDDGRATTARAAFCAPASTGLYHVNVMLGNGG
jgi:hypothetical protein